MIRIAAVGLLAVILITQLPEDKKEYRLMTAMCTGLYMAVYGAEILSGIVSSITGLVDRTGINREYISLLLKCFGISYIGDFAGSLCRDAGNSAIAKQIELVSKLTILALSMPVITGLVETIELFCG